MTDKQRKIALKRAKSEISLLREENTRLKQDLEQYLKAKK